MKREYFTYVVLIPKRQWGEYKTTEKVFGGLFNSTFEALDKCPTSSRIMPIYEFWKELNQGIINVKDNWIGQVIINQTLAEYYKLEAR